MAAVPIYVWNGTAWQETGPVIPASPIKYQASAPSSPSTGDIWVDSDGDVTSGSTQLVRYRFVASGGETSLSGNDANGATLAYTAGMEQVGLNGAVLVRGFDYTATNGTSITGLSPALVANDVVEVFSFMAFNVANTYTQSQVDGLIDAAPGMKLIVPTSAVNGTVGATGAVTFTTASTLNINGCFNSTYTNYKIIMNVIGSTVTDLRFKMRASGTDSSGAYYWVYTGVRDTGGSYQQSTANDSSAAINYISVQKRQQIILDICRPFEAEETSYTGKTVGSDSTSALFTNPYMFHAQNISYDGFSLIPGSGTITGTVRVYGYKN